MTSKERKRLNKILEKHYWKNGQQLYFTSVEIFDDKSCSLDIVLTDKKGKDLGEFLFFIQNYDGFCDLRLHIKPYNSDRYICKETWDGVKASYTPYYFDRTFTVHKFTPLTVNDIKNALKHFLHKELNNYCLIFNVKFITNNESLADKLLEERKNEKN